MRRIYTLLIASLLLLLSIAAHSQVFQPQDYAASRFAVSTANMMEEMTIEQQIQMNEEFCCDKKHFAVAFGELIALQVIPWYFNRHVADDSTADLSLESWGRNLRSGMEWDPNAFQGNMFQHPFHGNLFFNAARSNGYSFWESYPFAFAGSMMWEMFGENNHAAINDWVMTSLGGITIGEGLHRAAKMLRDNTKRGAGRTFRELGAFLLDPVGSFNRVVRGEWSKVGPNPEDRFPEEVRTYSILGYREVGEGRLTNTGSPVGFYFLEMDYGHPMEDYKRPFDSFQIRFQLNGGSEKSGIGILTVYGSLYGSELKNTEKVRHVFTIEQMYDYLNNETYEAGGQSFGFGVRSEWKFTQKTQIHTMLQPVIYTMTGIISENTLIGDRDYDFGSGFGMRVGAAYVRNGYPYFSVSYDNVFSHTLNGSKGNQFLQFVYSRLQFPIWRSVGVGVEYLLYSRDTYLRDFDDIHRTNPELRVGISFTWDTLN